MTALPEVLEKLVPREKVLPDLLLATYHESRGWNDCRQAMLTLIREHGPALLRDAGDGSDSARLDWLERHLVEVREPLRYGSAHMFYALQVNDEGEPYRSNLRQRIDAAMHAPGGVTTSEPPSSR